VAPAGSGAALTRVLTVRRAWRFLRRRAPNSDETPVPALAFGVHFRQCTAVSRGERSEHRVSQIDVDLALLERDLEAWRRLLQRSKQVLDALKNRVAEVAAGKAFKTDRL
jgi:hypothetical protein